MLQFQVCPDRDRIKIKLPEYNHEVVVRHWYDNNVIYLPIFKNGSTSIENCLNELKNNKPIDAWNFENSNTKKFCFTIVRDPMERLISGFVFLQGFWVEDLGYALTQKRKIISKGDQNKMDENLFYGLCHFIPQRHMIKHFEAVFDIKYYQLKNLQSLQRKLQKIYKSKIIIPHNNKTKNLIPKRTKKTLEWISDNKKFVDEYLKEDYKWLNSLTIN